MLELLTDLELWQAQGQHIALATVVNTWGSSPRPVGAKMGITNQGGISGSVSAGCVEGAVVDEGKQTLQSGIPKLLHYGVSDDAAFEVGLMCGGKIEIFVRPLIEAFLAPLREAFTTGKAVCIATIIQAESHLLGQELLLIQGEERIGMINNDLVQTKVTEEMEQALRKGKCQWVEHSEPEPYTIFIDVMTPPPSLVMIGGVHISIALSSLAKILGYRTIVIDPRKAFITSERFPDVDLLLQTWPTEAFQEKPLNSVCAVAILSHDPKIDDPALISALKSDAFYVGALGSRRTQELRRQRMLEAGISETQYQQLHGPIGLNIGAHTPEEIAISIMAEIIQIRNQP